MIDRVQLDLFSWDRIKVGEGFNALEMLDLQVAADIFEDILQRWHGHPDAIAGQRMAFDWIDFLKKTETLEKEEAVIYLWEKIKSYSFGQGGQVLRKGLIQRIITLLEGDYCFYISPDLCLGCLYMDIAEYSKAEEALKMLAEQHPRDGKILVYLGNCLWLQGRAAKARAIYAKAILTSPWDMKLEEFTDKELVEAIVEEDIYLAPLSGWLRRILPLIDIDIEKPHDKNHEWLLMIYNTIKLAEKARLQHDHKKMVEMRRLLKESEPAVFLEYMGRICSLPHNTTATLLGFITP
jgi:tetratricopeptide (TPR) repeat protein